MKKVTKIATTVLALTLVVSMLSACGAINVITHFTEASGLDELFGSRVDIIDPIYEPVDYDIDPEPTPEPTPEPQAAETATFIPYIAPIENVIDNTPRNINDIDFNNIQIGVIYYLGNFEESEKLKFDFDGNGKKENLTCSVDSTGFNYTFKIGKQKITDLVFDYFSQEAYVVSLDGETFCLILIDYGPSDDPITYFISYKDNTITELARLFFDILSPTSAICCRNNDPYTVMIYGAKRMDIVQTEFMTKGYYYEPYYNTINDDFTSSVYKYSTVLQDTEYSDIFTTDDYHITILEDIPVYKDCSRYAEKYTLKPGKCRFTYTDGLEFIFIECEDGSNGWFDGAYAWDDTGKWPYDLFDGLCFAD